AMLHILGKDITRFHCVIWPAMLMSAGVELPRTEWAHGFVSVSGGKISKDAGSELELDELIERHGSDAFRYFLVREAPWDGDRDFAAASELLDRFDQRYNADLANDLGNLVSRTAAMVHKYRQGSVPAGAETPLDEARISFAASYHGRMQDYRLHEGLKEVFGLVRRANVYIDEVQPWQLAKEGKAAAAQLEAALGSLVRCLRGVAAMLGPFMPGKAAEIWLRMGGGDGLPSHAEAAVAPDGASPTESRATKLEVRRGPPLFPRYEPEN
ncbi:MAG: class I tRNA ligase family protein, partial [Gemmatimonadales bacterium]